MRHKEMVGRRDSHSHRPSLCNFFLRVEDSLLALRRRGSTAVKRAGEADVRTRSARRSTFFSARREDGTEEAEEKEIRSRQKRAIDHRRNQIVPPTIVHAVQVILRLTGVSRSKLGRVAIALKLR